MRAWLNEHVDWDVVLPCAGIVLAVTSIVLNTLGVW